MTDKLCKPRGGAGGLIGSIERHESSEHPYVPFRVRLRFWLSFARGKHRREMELLLHEAKLGKKPRKAGGRWQGWNNVIGHQVAQAAAIRVLAHALKLPHKQIERQEIFAFVHDARKHIEKAPDDYVDSERNALDTKLREIFEEVDPDGVLRTATTEDFFYKLFERTPGASLDEKIANTPKHELLQYYIDGLFVDGTIVSPQERIDETEERHPELNDDPDRTQRLGMNYWDAERVVAAKVQKVLWEALKEREVRLPSPQSLPDFIRNRISLEMVEHWRAVHSTTGINT